MDEIQKPTIRRLRLRYPTVCDECGAALAPGTEALWNRETKNATCLTCVALANGTIGEAGASAAGEGERRTSNRVERVRRRHGERSATVAEKVAKRDEAQTWGKGSAGEAKLASFIARELGDRVIALHDRLIPGTKRNVDHIFVAPTGVWVVDAKAYKGRVVKKDVGPIWRRENKVYVGGKDQTKLARGVESQVEVVLETLRLEPACKGTLVYGVLCFVESDRGVFDYPFQVGSVWVLYPRALRKRLKKNGPLSREAMERVARAIALGLPAATSG